MSTEEDETLQIYEQIESIKSSLTPSATTASSQLSSTSSLSNLSEQWIQRQNLQDLYHQVILKYSNLSSNKQKILKFQF